MNILEKVEQAILPAVNAAKMELVDLMSSAESGKKVVRIFLDKEGGITLGDCEGMSAKLGAILDASDIFPGGYILEVSSPGLDRVLKGERDFKKFIGKKAKITLYAPINGQRNFTGTILSVSEGKATVDDLSSKTVEIPFSAIANARLEPDFDIIK